MGEAGPGEVICSRTVKDLVVGSGSRSRIAAWGTLKGVPDEWRLYAVEAGMKLPRDKVRHERRPRRRRIRSSVRDPDDIVLRSNFLSNVEPIGRFPRSVDGETHGHLRPRHDLRSAGSGCIGSDLPRLAPDIGAVGRQRSRRDGCSRQQGGRHHRLRIGGVTSALLFAATYPTRASGLLLQDGAARLAAADDYPFGIPPTLWTAS